MSKLPKVLALAGVMLFQGQTSSMLAADACPKLLGGTPTSRLEFLHGEHSTLDRDCIVLAIREFGNERFAAAISTLVDYLDFREADPPNWGTARSPFIPRHGQTRAGNYPAVGALFQIGKAAVPKLLEAIASSKTSNIARANAGDAIMAIYREEAPSGIALVVNAAHADSDPPSSVRLMDEARRQAAMCLPAVKNDCESAMLK